MEVHKGKIDEEKESKTEILFCAKPPHMYDNPETFDGADLSNLDLGGGDYMPIVLSFVYLGSTMSGDCTDTLDVRNRIEKAGCAFGALRDCLFKSTSISYEAKSFVYCRLILSVAVRIGNMVPDGILMAGVELLPLKMYQGNVPNDEEAHKSSQNIEHRSTRETESETDQIICHQATVTLGGSCC